jgi:carboxyl-terminal processing protease
MSDMSDNNDNHDERKRRKPGLAAALAACAFFAALFIAPAIAAEATDKGFTQYYSVIENVFDFISKNYVDEVDPNVLYEGALKGMFESLNDPHSVYLDENNLTDLTDVTSGEFGGVGLYISKQEKDPRFPDAEQYIEVISPIEDTPGWKAGFLPGDIILKIDGESTAGLSSDDAVKKIRGPANTAVELAVRRGGAAFTVSVKRAVIEIPVVKKDVLPGGIGYMRLIDFTPQTAPRVKEALTSFNDAKVKAIIIDLRNNPGGLLPTVVQVSDYFLSQGPIVSTKSRHKEENFTYNAKADLVVGADIPVVVLINKGSASASEILAGALKDQKRAYLIGETSYGKGSVQQFYSFGKTGFKLTMARYYTPSDANIDKIGIEPDMVVKTPDMTDPQVKQIEALLTAGTLKDWAEKHKGASKSDITAYVKGLQLKDFGGFEWVVERMARDEINRTSFAPVYDLDYDFVLRAAVKLINETPDFNALLKTTKTVRQVQDENAAKNPKLSAADKAKAGAKASPGALPAPSLDGAK